MRVAKYRLASRAMKADQSSIGPAEFNPSSINVVARGFIGPAAPPG
jgi:hypothetical protein